MEVKEVVIMFENKPVTLKYKNDTITLSWKYLKKPIILKSTKDNCLECVSHSLTWNGYPKITFNSTTRRLNRFMYCLFNKIEYNATKIKGYVLCHTCDNRLCVNLDHLIKGTHEFNMQDMCDKERQARGVRNSNAKLNPVDVDYIRSSEMDNAYLADVFCVSLDTIIKVRRRKTWKHV